MVTRLVSKKCDVVMLNRKETATKLKLASLPHIVGNPLRGNFKSYERTEARKAIGLRDGELFIVSFGGSLGSAAINKAILNLYNSDEFKLLSARHVHSTGTRYYGEIIGQNDILANQNKNLLIKPFIDNMPLYLTAADLAITRSGAITLSELAYSGTPAILIPSPNVTDDHQMKNALCYSKNGAARVISEDELQGTLLKDWVCEILTNKSKRNAMRRAARKEAVEGTSEKIIEALFENSKK
jgi:UDP-N-acetylglucosamine--N-acetylmuramyl-(pentapeptide) pyrophosphoryl-undecaprenol N-acetylglucosamine transferase